MTPSQCLEARRLLNWGRTRLAAMIDANHNTINLFETTGRMARPTGFARKIDRVAAARVAFEAAGIEFIWENDGGPGVRLKAAT